MSKIEEEQEDNIGLGSFSIDEMFNTDKIFDQQEEDDQLDLLQYDGVEKPVEEEIEEEEEGQDTDDDSIDFDNDDISEEEKIDLIAFNKKFGKDFKNEEELKSFLDGKEEKEEAVTDDKILEQAENQLAILEPVILLSNEALMRKELETIALQKKKDLNDEDVKIEIEDDLQDMIDKGILDIKASYLRDKLIKIVDDSKKSKNDIVQKREALQKETEKTEKEQLQKELVAFHGLDSFYGVKLNKETVANVYKKINNGEFIKTLTTDKKAMAELALMAEVKETIFKKSSGLTYNDGIKAILDEFKSNPKEDTIAKAQSRGGAASAGGQDGLIRSILMEKPIEEKK